MRCRGGDGEECLQLPAHPSLCRSGLLRTPRSAATPYSRLAYPASLQTQRPRSRAAHHRQPRVWGESLLSQYCGVANQPDRPCPFPRMYVRITRPPWPRASLKPLADLSPLLPTAFHGSLPLLVDSSFCFQEACLLLRFQLWLAWGKRGGF